MTDKLDNINCAFCDNKVSSADRCEDCGVYICSDHTKNGLYDTQKRELHLVCLSCFNTYENMPERKV